MYTDYILNGKFTEHFIKNLSNLTNDECKFAVVRDAFKAHSLFDIILF